ncbi:hypothetical protein GCM10023260_04370 [Bartonella acomydis]|uniref:Uncharacterized protein n=1 Tax=Bartonella acomydis TaxID=686234 RepID=A0ABP9MKN7_9HYPH
MIDTANLYLHKCKGKDSGAQWISPHTVYRKGIYKIPQSLLSPFDKLCLPLSTVKNKQKLKNYPILLSSRHSFSDA